MTFLGRHHERAVLRELIEGARSAAGDAILVTGPAGIGKTALIAETIDEATGVRVLQTTGAQYEMELPFAALQQLLQPLAAGIETLPEPQARAVASALGTGETVAPTSVLVALGTLNLLTWAAQERPVICVVDDTHWLDDASSQVLAFVVRRLSGVAVSVIFMAREPLTSDALSGVTVLQLRGLEDTDARTLLHAGLRAPLDPRVRDRILAEAQGNPLALLELPRSADLGALAGGYGVPAAAQLPRTLEANFQERLERLPAQARRFLLVASADPTGDPVVVWRAARHLGLDPVAASHGVDAGLIQIDIRIRFRHPLVRSAIYESATVDDRRAVHDALASATDALVDPERRAWHAAQAAAGPDEQLAEELERLADRARSRGGLAASGAFLEQAAVLTPDAGLQARRLLAAARARQECGDFGRALQLVASAEAIVQDPLLLAQAQVVRARVAFDRGRDEPAVRGLIAAARAVGPFDVLLGRDVLFDALAAANLMGRFATWSLTLDLAEAVRDLPVDDERMRPLDRLLDPLIACISGGKVDPAVIRPVLDLYLEHGSEDVEATRGVERFGIGELWLACQAALDIWDDQMFIAASRQQLDYARDNGALAGMPIALTFRAMSFIHEGRFAQAQRLVDEAYAVSAEIGAPGMAFIDMSIAAYQGDRQRVRELTEQATADATARGEGRLLTAAELATTTSLNGMGQFAAAADACRTAVHLREPGFPPWLIPEFVEGAARSGRPQEALEMVEHLERVAAEMDTDWCTGTGLYVRALISTGEQADISYREGITRLARTTRRPDLARARLSYGEWLAGEDRKGEAREQLEAAHEMFLGMGARDFAGRASRALRAVTGVVRHHNAGEAALTAAEQAVTRLVAGGATSKEAAAELFISPRTVDAHLRSIFAKLGVKSRRELRDVYRETAEGPR
ncbi:helix-turn-helix transcriptional regulator [Actinoplanes cyaneus]|uniref:Helix-turn-helix transcriptional regulator n=1 Tax=Actinoplanes cyaneus TaxID=52696 RepID=A0A919IT43_9ACTN|nr:LuxR family transcriptional regulator [Actinoplanes cyaneus]MCW2144080.1 regulatory protein, luxR family [Actinoplanes cyaneus]GID70771.1 helix-turn-helix transcriptional regulator [Actinoplanes cyaneus]